ncbi:MAG: tetratricopeptide repeat protein [Elainellaceae cyanobacterium]
MAVFGNAGGGKSTLSQHLAEMTGLPWVPLDSMKYKPGGDEVPRAEFKAARDALLQQEQWVIDGFGSLNTVWQRLDAADTLVYLDICLFFPVMQSKRLAAQTQPIQVQKTEVDQLIEQCSQLFEQADYQQVLETCTKAVEAAREIGDRQDEVYALLNLGSAYGALGRYPKALDYFEPSWQLAQEIGDRQGEAYALLNLGSAHKSLGQYAKAIDYLERSLQLSQELGNRRGEAYSLINLGSANWSLRRYRKAIDYSEQSLLLTQAIGDRRGEVCSLINLGSAYGSLEAYPKAIDSFRQSLRIAQDTDDRRGEAIALNNLGYVLYRANRLAAAETYLRQAIDVFESLRPALSDADKLSLFETLTNPYYNLQEVLVAQGKAIEALEIAERGRARAFVELLAKRLASAGGRSLAEAQVATPIMLTEIQQVARDQDATLVEYSVAASDRLYIWVVSPAGKIAFRQVDLSQFKVSLDDLVSATSATIVKHPPQTATIFSLTMDRSHPAKDSNPNTGLQRLHQILIAPIQDLLPTNPDDHIIFVPHSTLSRLEVFSSKFGYEAWRSMYVVADREGYGDGYGTFAG